MTDNAKCFVCGEIAEYTREGKENSNAKYRCTKCGNYYVTGTLTVSKNVQERDHLVNLRGWIYTRNREGEIPTLSTENYDRIISLPIPNVSRRLEKLLISLTENQQYLGALIQGYPDLFLGVSYSATWHELEALMNVLLKKHHVTSSIQGWSVTVDGFIAIEGFLGVDEFNSKQAFVAMWFNDEMTDAYENGIKRAVFAAGYQPFRVDQHEHTNKIDDEIIAQIRRSMFLVADMTGHRGGVYYEAGFAYGLGLPVILTCRKDALDDLHFDIRQYNCIVWETPEQLRDALTNRIKAAIV